MDARPLSLRAGLLVVSTSVEVLGSSGSCSGWSRALAMPLRSAAPRRVLALLFRVLGCATSSVCGGSLMMQP